MSLREQIEKALSTPFDAAAQGLDETEYRGLGVWHNGPTLEESWVKISRELNLESGTFEGGVWKPSPNWDAPTDIDILDETGVKGTGKGEIKDVTNLKKKFNALKEHLPPGEYGMNADHPTKARMYQRTWLNDPDFRLSGIMARGKISPEEAAKLTKKGIPLKFETMVMTIPQNRFNVNNLEETELRRFAEKWLTDNPDKTLKEFRIENGYTGPPLKPKQGRGQPIRVSFKNPDKARAYQAERQRKLNEIKLKNPEADAEYILNQEIASEYTDLTDDDLIARQVTEGKRHVADHGKYPKGGDDLGRSRVIDPTFNANKQAIEKRVTAFNKKIDSGSISVDLNEVGEIIAGPEATYNAHDPGKSQGWKVIPEGLNTEGIDARLSDVAKLGKVTKIGNLASNNPVTRALGIGNDARLASVVENMTDIAKGISPGARFGMSVLPGLGIVGDTADAAVKLEEAQAPDASWLDKTQATVASTVAATSVIPEPTAQAYNLVAGLGLGASDVIEHYGESIWRHLGTVKHPLKGFYK